MAHMLSAWRFHFAIEDYLKTGQPQVWASYEKGISVPSEGDLPERLIAKLQASESTQPVAILMSQNGRIVTSGHKPT